MIEATPSEGKTVDEVEQGIRSELARLQQGGITEDELLRVKAQVLAAKVYQRDSMFYQAMLIGNLESSGLSWRDEKALLDKLKAVTAEQVKEVANKYLQDDGLTVVTLAPQPLDGKKPVATVQGGGHAH